MNPFTVLSRLEIPADSEATRNLLFDDPSNVGESSILSRREFSISAASMLLCQGTLSSAAPATELSDVDEKIERWSAQFAQEVDHRLDVPKADQLRYLLQLQQALTQARLTDLADQAFLLVDRSPQIQAAMLIVRAPANAWHWLGATAVSTGKPGKYEHFVSPLGVFAHTLDNPDFRSLGTFNKNKIRGYGLRGMRVFDFGWQNAERGWGKGGESQMRLQMHATDPDVLERRLGQVESEGCIRIPASLNAFLDTHGVLDADYEAALLSGKKLWVLNMPRQVIAWPGRYMVIVDSTTLQRPSWSPMPNIWPI